MKYSIQINTKQKTRHYYIELAQIVLESGYVPKLRKNPINGLSGIKDGSDVERSVYHILDDIPNHESMLELLLKYDAVGQPTKEELKGAYEERYNTYLWYKQRWIDGDNINKKRPFYVDLPIRHLEKYCIDINGTFQDVREFFAWANKQNLLNQIIWISDTEKVIYKSKFDTIYNKVNIIDANSKKE